VRHGEWFSRLGRDDALLAHALSGSEQRVDRLALDVANLDVACRRACARGDEAVAADACVAACAVYAAAGPRPAGHELADLTLTLDSIPPRRRVRVQLAAGLVQQGDSAGRAAAHFAEALAIARDLSDPLLEGRAVVGLGLTDFARGRTEDLDRHAARALEIATCTGDPALLVDAWRLLGDASQARGLIEESLAHYEAAMAACREVGDAVMEATILTKAANTSYHAGRSRPDAVMADLERALAVLEKTGSWQGATLALRTIASIHADAGRSQEARLHLDAALRLAERAGARAIAGRVLQNLGGLDLEARSFDDAQARFEQSLSLLAGVHPHHEAESHGELAAVALARGRSDEAVEALQRSLAIEHCGGSCFLKAELLRLLGRVHLDFGRVPEAARALSEAEPIMLGLPYPRTIARFLCTRGECELASGDPERARASLVAARALVEGAGDNTFVREAIEALESALRKAGSAPA
jgi:tetratricopeptide (TPR) repeat protein